MGPITKWIVIAGCHSFQEEDVSWMDDDRIGNNVVVPSLDLVDDDDDSKEQFFEFDTFREAKDFVANW